MSIAASLILFVIGAGSTARAVITVTNSVGVINGDVSSPEALLASPGPDGISLPEAVAAANNAVQPQDVTFAPALAGQRIVLTFPLLITRDGTTINGPIGQDGQPSIMVDGRQAIQLNGVLYVLASDVTVRGLRFVWTNLDCLSVLAGADTIIGSDQPRPRQVVRNVVIEDNVFGEAGSQLGKHAGVRIYMEPEGNSVDALIENVRVSGNSFLRDSSTVAVVVAANGWNCRISNVVIDQNSFDNLQTNAIFLESAQGSGNVIHGTRILHNTFVSLDLRPAIFIFHLVDPPPPRGTLARSNTIDETTVEGNSFRNGVEVVGGQGGATDCVISNTLFVNNQMSEGGISIIGGKSQAVGNRIVNLRFVNNTLTQLRVDALANTQDSSGNTIEGLSFSNTIFGPETGFNGITPENVSFSLSNNTWFRDEGTGNLVGDPCFVDPANGDLHLQVDSPAIDAGTPSGAPSVDIECRPRDGQPDMGAFEYGAPETACILLTVDKGSGAVETNPQGLACGRSTSFPLGSEVRLTARPSPGWRFVGWNGDPDCLDGTVTMSTDRRCAATFEITPPRVRRRLR